MARRKPKKQSKNKKQKQKPKKNNKRVAGQIGSVVGNMALPGIGGMAGKYIGQSAYSLFKKITGYGDYTVSKNSLMNGSVPVFSNKSTGNNRFVNKEFIMDVKGSINFLLQLSQEQINPGNPVLFPWLSTLSQNFQEYKLHGLIFYLKTTSGSAVSSTNAALGTLVMGTQYNPYDAPFTGKQQMENTMYSTPTAPNKDAIHPVECALNQTTLTTLNIRNSTNNGSGQDARFYDLGVFSLASVGMQADNINLAELHVSYDIEFLKPITTSSFGGQQYHWQSSAGISASAPFGTNPTLTSSSSPYGLVTINGAQCNIHPSVTGGLLINIHIRCASSTVSGTLLINYGTLTKPIYLFDGGLSAANVTGGTTCTSVNIIMAVQCLGGPQGFTIASADTWSGCFYTDVVVTPLALTN